MKFNKLHLFLIILLFLAVGTASAADIDDNNAISSVDADVYEINNLELSDGGESGLELNSDQSNLEIGNTDDAKIQTSEEPKLSAGLKKAIIIAPNMTTTVLTSTEAKARIGEYFNITLTDEAGNPLEGKKIQIGFNGKTYNRTTNASGQAQLQINLATVGGHTFAVSFLNDVEYQGSFVVAKITVTKKTTSLTVPTKTYKASAKTKSFTATLKDNRGNLVSGKKISFTVNGKAYSATTNSKGVATVNISIKVKGTYAVTAKFAGDKTYNTVTKKGTLKLT